MALEENNEFWREIVDSLTDAIVVVSRDLEVIAINSAAETLLGASRIRRTLSERLFGPNHWLAGMVGECVVSGLSFSYPETGLRLAQSTAIVRAEVSPLMKASGETEGAAILLQDLTSQQSAESALRADPDALRLSSAGLAHEVKNPLTGI